MVVPLSLTAKESFLTELPLPRAVTSATLYHLEQLIDGASFGSILIDPAGVILWSNAAARTMHGVATTADLGATADDYCRRFSLSYRNHHRLQARDYPIMRLLAGEPFDDVVVDVMPKGDDAPRWTHKVRDVVMSDDDGEPDCLALVIEDASAKVRGGGSVRAHVQREPGARADHAPRRPALRPGSTRASST